MGVHQDARAVTTEGKSWVGEQARTEHACSTGATEKPLAKKSHWSLADHRRRATPPPLNAIAGGAGRHTIVHRRGESGHMPKIRPTATLPDPNLGLQSLSVPDNLFTPYQHEQWRATIGALAGVNITHATLIVDEGSRTRGTFHGERSKLVRACGPMVREDTSSRIFGDRVLKLSLSLEDVVPSDFAASGDDAGWPSFARTLASRIDDSAHHRRGMGGYQRKAVALLRHYSSCPTTYCIFLVCGQRSHRASRPWQSASCAADVARSIPCRAGRRPSHPRGTRFCLGSACC